MSFNARALGLRLTAAETIDLGASAGFGGVDLLVRDIHEAGEDVVALNARMNGLGLRAGAFPLPLHWRGSDAEFSRDLEVLPLYTKMAAALGLTRTATWVMPETPEGIDDLDAVVSFHVDRLGKIARELDTEGIRLGLEVIGVESSRTGKGKPFVQRMADLDRVLGAVWDAAPNLGVLVDVFHLYAAGEGVEAGLAWGVDRVVWVHVSDLPRAASRDRAAIHDPDRGLPGENGAVPTAALLARLADSGYDGPVTAEPFACRSLQGVSPAEVARRVKAALDSVWPENAGRTSRRSRDEIPRGGL